MEKMFRLMRGCKKNAHLRKIWMTMKLTILLFFLAITQMMAIETYSQSTRLTLNLKSVAVKDALDQIEEKSEFIFLYNSKLVDVDRIVSLEFKDQKISEVLDKLFQETGVVYTIVDRQIVLSNKADQASFLVLGGVQQADKVSGKVTDSTGASLPGVTVLIKGTTIGTISDSNGNYSLSNVPSSATLQFSFVGMKTQESAVGSQNTINVILLEETIGIEEVVAVGYGTTKKKDLTGSVGQMQSKELKNMPVSRVDQALTGKLAGVQVLTTNGKPGASPTIRIRGIGSVSAGSEPLYVVDGYPIDNLQMLNPNDIETIDILKDVSATAIYGSRGANGVILISTKRGKTGSSVISLDMYYGWQKILKSMDFLTVQEQAQYYYDGVKNQNLDAGKSTTGEPLKWFYAVPQTIMDVLGGQNTTDTDAFDAILRTAPMQSYNLSAKGGNETVKYAVSGEYMNQEGIVISSNFNRYSLRSNLDAQLSKRLAIKFNLNTAYTTNDDIIDSGNNGGGEGIVGSANTWQRWYPLYKADGAYFSGYGQDATNNVWNPVATANEITRKSEQLRILGNIYSEYNISDALKFNFMFGANTSNRHYFYFIPKLDVFNNVPAEGSDERSSSLNWITESTLNYNKSYGNHNISGLIGYTTEKNNNGSNYLSSRSYPNNLVYTLNAVSNILYQGNSQENEWSLLSYLARLNYNYKNKYYLTASIRSDGSSRFGIDKKYGYFPSAALAWRISDENFLKDVSFISDMKIRFSYGESGNNNIGNYAHLATVGYESYNFGGAATGGYAPSQYANSLLTWEKQRSTNVGLDLSLLESRITFIAEYFKTTNHELLLNVFVPLITGFNTSLQNIGEVENKGWEFTLNTKNLIGNFEWTTDFNISGFKNKVIKLGPEGAPIISGNNITQIGQPMGMFYGYITDGIFATQAELDAGPKWAPGTADASRLGDIRFKDVSGPAGVPDGVINTADRAIMGNPYPDFYYGMTNSFTYKKVTLIVALMGSVGNQILNSSDNQLYTRARYKQLSIVKDYWKSEAEPGNDPRPNNNPTGGLRQYSTRYLTDASYFMIKNVNLSYSFSEKIASKLSMGSLRVYLTASNPLLVTKFLYFNPEVSNSSSSLTPGLLNYNYPVAKSFVIGINASF
ncbi:MAG TPA: SusC/RagA family TonB-linked outer membrane protein [Prolixibacteraceae bacterium]|nr:SusC/RagA family TonB-linked outer membrane protein [Prolixibacteraceae bacterium]